MTPKTGMQYSEEVSLELARRLSAAAQRLSSSFSMSLSEAWLIECLCLSDGSLALGRNIFNHAPVKILDVILHESNSPLKAHKEARVLDFPTFYEFQETSSNRSNGRVPR
jgi:hypothetical protein